MNAVFPALYLYPLNDSFAPKHIGLLPGQHVKIGRQTNAKTTPGERNGYFDSKVLSRQHAEVWADAEKIFIKDVKSSNGTFINGERLSLEGLESDPFELHTDDIVEFGIDIVGEDNKTIIHHKVAARVFCVFSEQDAQVAARAEQHSQHQHQQQQQQHLQQQQQQQQQFQPPQPGASGSSFNFGHQQAQRRPMNQGLTGMGGMGGSMRPPGKSGLTFEHIVSRLQGEIQKSRETGAELHTLTGAMGEIHDTLGGTMPQSLPPYPHSLPLPRPSGQQQPQQQQQPPPAESTSSPTDQSSSSPVPPVALSELQVQLSETHSSLASYVERIHALENALVEQESVKHEVRVMREMMESKRRELSSSEEEPRTTFEHELDDEDELRHEDDDDDSDARSIATIGPHELESVEEEEEEEEEEVQQNVEEEHLPGAGAEQEELDLDGEDARHRRHVEEQSIGRPHTPEPNSLGMSSASSLRSTDFHHSSQTVSPLDPSVIDDLTARLSNLANQLESALELGSALQAQHAAAQSTISVLEAKVGKLEGLIQAPLAAAAATESPSPSEPSLMVMLNDWKRSVEGQWSSVQEEWTCERERLAKAREEWESKSREYELRNSSTASWAMLNGDIRPRPNHEKRNGLVTPPSPRSLSADSHRRSRKRRTSSQRGRSRSGSRSSRGDNDTDITLASDTSGGTRVDKDLSGPGKDKYVPGQTDVGLPTPEASLRGSLSSSADSDNLPRPDAKKEDDSNNTNVGLGGTKGANPPVPPNVNVQAAIGVLVLSMAAAAVVWRVKPVPAS